MYHIKEDERFVRSSELLYRGLIDLIKTKPLDKISILELSNISTVSRATIYRNFDSLIDILYWKCNTKFAEILNGYVSVAKHNEQKDEFLIHLFRAWNRDCEVLEWLIKVNRVDIIFRCFKENAYIVIDYMSNEIKFSGTAYEYFISVRIGIFVGIIDTWIRLGKQETAEQIVEMLVSQLQSVEQSTMYF